jgi:succinyl-diaminopimelate desuccinylase
MALQDYLAELVRRPTESRNESDIQACFDWLESELASHDLRCVGHVSNKRLSLVATTQATRTPKVFLQAHVDVVPASKDGFKLREEDGKLHGRGVYDMKFAAACYLQLLDDLKDELDQYDFGIMLTSDEEIGGKNGVKMLIEEGYRSEVCVMPDGGDNWKLETSCNAVWIIYLTAMGVSAHGSRPWEGDNAIDKLFTAIQEIKQVFGQQELGRSSLTVSQIKGGYAVNQVPNGAEATLDMRFVNEADLDTMRQKVQDIAKKYDLEIQTHAEAGFCPVDVEHPHVAKFIDIARQIRGHEIEEMQSLGASDARYFAEKDIPVILIRPHGGGAHSENEWIDKAGFEQFYQVLKAYVTAVAKRT